MESARRAGWIVGLLLLVHLAIGLMAPFIIRDVVRGSAGLLASAAGSPGLFRTALLLLVVGSSMAIAVVVAGGSVFRRHSEPTALALVALAVAAFVLQVVDTGALMSVLALAALAATGCVLQLAGVSVPGLLGIRPMSILAMPLAPAYLAVALWLTSKGFAERPAASGDRTQAG